MKRSDRILILIYGIVLGLAMISLIIYALSKK